MYSPVGKRFITYSSKKNPETKKYTAYVQYTSRNATGKHSYVSQWHIKPYLMLPHMMPSILTNGGASPVALQSIPPSKLSKRWIIAE